MNILCLDAPLIALLWQEVFAFFWQVRLFFPERALLFLAVWGVYLADRCLDAWHARTNEPAHSPRHYFAGTVGWWMAAFSLVSFCLCLWLGFFVVPSGTVQTAIPLSMIVLGYAFWRHCFDRGRSDSFGRSILVAILFGSGCMLIPIGLLLQIPQGLLPLWACFVTLLFVNHRMTTTPPHSEADRQAAPLLMTLCAGVLVWSVWLLQSNGAFFLPAVLPLMLSAAFLLFLLAMRRRESRAPAHHSSQVLPEYALLLPPILTGLWMLLLG